MDQPILYVKEEFKNLDITINGFNFINKTVTYLNFANFFFFLL